ncbi:NAD(P)-dependent oxidoreductase [Embleya scabrispora]|uniref:NAD(P)-dependent oxidoreductase n=1 Tax=Embleya scabrispora TaxID=159449 RepID=UPI000365F717|nr:NAD(P)H-binding protein [Embleya scabrispora]
MSGIIVFGAGGRTGRTAVAEALRRGHRVTAVVRDPAKYSDLAGPDVRVCAGDVTDADAVAELAAGHDAAIAAVFDPAAPVGDFFVRAVRALLDGLARAGVGRLVWVGLASVLPAESGELLMDTPGYPQEYRAFFLAHAEGNATLRAAGSGAVDDAPHVVPEQVVQDQVVPEQSTPEQVAPERIVQKRVVQKRVVAKRVVPEWVVLSPSGDFDHEGVRTGYYRAAPADAESRVSYPDFAIALLDEVDAPKLRGVHVGIEDGR